MEDILKRKLEIAANDLEVVDAFNDQKSKKESSPFDSTVDSETFYETDDLNLDFDNFLSNMIKRDVLYEPIKDLRSSVKVCFI